MKKRSFVQVLPEGSTMPKANAFGSDLTAKELHQAAVVGFKTDVTEEATDQAETEERPVEILGDLHMVSEEQKVSLMQLKEPQKYSTMKLKMVNLSFSGASVFFFTPYRADGTPMPASVMKFDLKECHWMANQIIGLTETNNNAIYYIIEGNA